MERARRIAETVARESYGRLLAMLAARTRDIAAAEDALSDAMMAALRTWPERGVPANPDAWLLTAARNALKNAARHLGVRTAAAPDILLLQEQTPDDGALFPDERLKLLFVCAHPAIDPAVRTPLMLQTILGLDAARIGSAFLVAPSTMGQRLVRAKARIRETGMRFEVPDPEDMPDRLCDVLSAIYAAYGTGWEGLDGAEATVRDLTEEAVYLARLLVSLLPDEPEAKGLLALMLYCEARRAARRDSSGQFVPLDKQDARLWSREMIIEAEALLTAAAGFRRFGRFQCEAAIQSVHVQRPITGRTNHEALITLYQLLASRDPTTGVLVSFAAVLVAAARADDALTMLETLPDADIRVYQPYWVVRARALHAVGERVQAAAALQTAIGLTEQAPVRAFLRSLLDDPV